MLNQLEPYLTKTTSSILETQGISWSPSGRSTKCKISNFPSLRKKQKNSLPTEKQKAKGSAKAYSILSKVDEELGYPQETNNSDPITVNNTTLFT